MKLKFDNGIDLRKGDARELAMILEAAAGVTRNGDENPEHINRWKYVCGYNLDKVATVADKAEKELNSVMFNAEVTDWDAALELIFASAGKAGLQLADGGTGASILRFGTDAMIEADLFTEADRDALDDYIREFKEGDKDGNLMKSVLLRAEAIERGAAALDEVVHIDCHQIDFKYIPERLHGGFMRELLWMVCDLPEDFEIKEAE